jgi:hypothetical protein
VKPSKRANGPTSSQSATVVANDDEVLDQPPDEFPTAVRPAEPVTSQEPTESAPVDSEPMEIEPIVEPSQHPPRQWTDQTGKFKVTATFVSFANGVVSIRKEDGTVIKIPATKLSDADRSYIQEQRYHKVQP